MNKAEFDALLAKEKASTLTPKEKLLLRKARIDNELKAMEAREREQSRKNETRQKIILGGEVMLEAKRNPVFKEWMEKTIQQLTRDHYRRTFGLAPLEKQKEEKPPPFISASGGDKPSTG